MAGHTPGPWTYDGYGAVVGAADRHTNGRKRNALGISNASYSDKVCTIYGEWDLPAPQANAHLIAAAPEMLEACKAALGTLCDGCEDMRDPCLEAETELDGPPCHAAKSSNMLCAAIKKAEHTG